MVLFCAIIPLSVMIIITANNNLRGFHAFIPTEAHIHNAMLSSTSKVICVECKVRSENITNESLGNI